MTLIEIAVPERISEKSAIFPRLHLKRMDWLKFCERNAYELAYRDNWERGFNAGTYTRENMSAREHDA